MNFVIINHETTIFLLKTKCLRIFYSIDNHYLSHSGHDVCLAGTFPDLISFDQEIL